MAVLRRKDEYDNEVATRKNEYDVIQQQYVDEISVVDKEVETWRQEQQSLHYSTRSGTFTEEDVRSAKEMLGLDPDAIDQPNFEEGMDKEEVWTLILKKILATCVKSNEVDAERIVMEICITKLSQIERGKAELLQFAKQIQEALDEIQWTLKIFHPREKGEGIMDLHGLNAFTKFTEALTSVEDAKWNGPQTNKVESRFLIQNVIQAMETRQRSKPNPKTASANAVEIQEGGAYPVRKRTGDKVVKRTNVEGKYSQKTEESEPVYEDELKEEPKPKKGKPKADD